MKSIFFISTLFLSFFFVSCGNKKNESSTKDSVTTDSSAIAIQPADTSASLPVEENVDPNAGVGDQPDDQPDLEDNNDFDYTYEGTINTTIKVRVNIFKYKGEMKARAVYLSSKKIINMDALYVRVGAFELTEKVGGKATGIWKIEVAEEDIFKGTWNSPDGKKQMPITLSMTPGDDLDTFLPKAEIKTGFYQLKQTNDDPETKEEFPTTYQEDLFVKNMADNTIYFDLYIQGPPPGVHMGMINGFAKKSGSSYIYTNDNGCQITMNFANNKVELSQKGSDMDCEFGAGIGAYGTLNLK